MGAGVPIHDVEINRRDGAAHGMLIQRSFNAASSANRAVHPLFNTNASLFTRLFRHVAARFS
jgi:hypothetical protein